jgi:membrane protease YdiL (CAAX protease family)
LARFFAVAFGLGWALMGLGLVLFHRAGGGFGLGLYQAALTLAMFAPLLGVLAACGSLRPAPSGIAWRPACRGRLRWYALAWWGPAVLVTLGAVFYFALFPARLDRGFGYLTEVTAGVGTPAGAAQLDLPPWAVALTGLVQAVTFAPAVNALVAVGEESGWRGFMTPKLAARLGRRRGLLLGGAIWGAWHWPAIIFGGYEYGTGYPGAPVTGMLAMCLFTCALGSLLSVLYERAGTIWVPALAHGAFNAIAGLPLYVLPAGTTHYLLGPAIAGPVAGLPLLALAALVLWRTPSGSGRHAPVAAGRSLADHWDQEPG